MSIGETLRNLIYVRKADPKTEPVKEWIAANERAEFDPKVLDYPSTTVLAAYNGDTLNYVPIKTVAVFDSVGFKPGIGQTQATAAMIEVVKAAIVLAHNGGMRELLFLTKDPSMVGGAQIMGFTELEDLHVLRMELPQ